MLTRIKNAIFNPAYCRVWIMTISLAYGFGLIQYYADVLYDLSLLWVFVVLVYNFLFTRHVYQYRYTFLLILFCISYAITIAINGFVINDIKVLFYTCMAFFILLQVEQEKSKEQVIRELGYIFKLIVIVGTVNMIISLIMYFVRYSGVVPSPWVADAVSYIGVHYNSSLYGLIGNSNKLSWLCLMTIAGLLFQMRTAKRKVFYIINVLLQLYTITISNSRGGAISVYVFFCAAAFLYCLSQSEGKRFFPNAAKIILVSVIVFAVSFGSIKLLKMVNSKVILPAIINIVEDDDEVPVETERPDSDLDFNVNARIQIYTAGFNVFKDHPVFGVGKENIPTYIHDYLPEGSRMNQEGLSKNLHNAYLQVLTSSGVVGSIFLFSYLLLSFRSSLKYLIYSRSKDKDIVIILLGLMVSIMVINLFESEIFLNKTFMLVIFWIAAGNVLYFINKDNEKYDRITKKILKPFQRIKK